jgi:hypothetical protein
LNYGSRREGAFTEIITVIIILTTKGNFNGDKIGH